MYTCIAARRLGWGAPRHAEPHEPARDRDRAGPPITITITITVTMTITITININININVNVNVDINININNSNAIINVIITSIIIIISSSSSGGSSSSMIMVASQMARVGARGLHRASDGRPRGSRGLSDGRIGFPSYRGPRSPRESRDQPSLEIASESIGGRRHRAAGVSELPRRFPGPRARLAEVRASWEIERRNLVRQVGHYRAVLERCQPLVLLLSSLLLLSLLLLLLLLLLLVVVVLLLFSPCWSGAAPDELGGSGAAQGQGWALAITIISVISTITIIIVTISSSIITWGRGGGRSTQKASVRLTSPSFERSGDSLLIWGVWWTLTSEILLGWSPHISRCLPCGWSRPFRLKNRSVASLGLLVTRGTGGSYATWLDENLWCRHVQRRSIPNDGLNEQFRWGPTAQLVQPKGSRPPLTKGGSQRKRVRWFARVISNSKHVSDRDAGSKSHRELDVPRHPAPENVLAAKVRLPGPPMPRMRSFGPGTLWLFEACVAH